MSFFKSLIAFILGIIMLFAFYYLISIPILPCIYIYVIALFLGDNKLVFRRFFIIIGIILGIYFYGANAILSIINYPEYLNIIGIIFELITCFAILSAGITTYTGIDREKRTKIE